MLPVQLEQGYAVAASGYRQPGWSGFSAVADNLELLERVVIDLGQPGQVIAYGQAMGGHAALQLALAPEQPLAAALPLCPIIRADQFWQAALDLRLLYGHTCDQVDGAALPAAADLPWLLPAHQISAPGLEQVVLRANRCLGLNLPDWQRSAGQQARLQQLQAASGIDDDGQLLLGLVHASLGLAGVVRGGQACRPPALATPAPLWPWCRRRHCPHCPGPLRRLFPAVLGLAPCPRPGRCPATGHRHGCWRCTPPATSCCPPATPAGWPASFRPLRCARPGSRRPGPATA